MFNESDTSLVMVGSPYHQHFNGNAYKGTPAVACPQFNTHLVNGSVHERYLRQQRTIEIIELVEVPPPTRRERISVPGSSSAASSSYTSSSGSDESDGESGLESYCSSEDGNEKDRSSSSEEEAEPPRIDTSYHARMRRIEQWRSAYAKAVGTELAPSPSRSKRKYGSNDEEDDTRSRSSKRSRQVSSSGSTSTSISASARSVHSCSACDACFPDRRSLHRHGFSPRTNEACRAAVEYDFEQ
ncbi:hypothetical protein DFH11DRAFT_1198065 [Phellopilus nigrolimitatus]|nr:hypothetical protein DFH11DRAFT_1198065 [Phellopilus nigrolimitatus]